MKRFSHGYSLEMRVYARLTEITLPDNIGEVDYLYERIQSLGARVDDGFEEDMDIHLLTRCWLNQ